jgi:hypothetical protein
MLRARVFCIWHWVTGQVVKTRARVLKNPVMSYWQIIAYMRPNCSLSFFQDKKKMMVQQLTWYCMKDFTDSRLNLQTVDLEFNEVLYLKLVES